MSYLLGIDFGTTFTAAAVRRPGGVDEPEVVPLGGRDGAVSSVLHLARDERVTVGEAAAGLAGIDPTRVARALKRRIGDPEPVVLGGHHWTAEELSARLLRWVVDRVVEREGAAPARIALAHPPSWTAHTLERLAAALAGQDLAVTFVTEPRAVAHAAAGATAAGDVVAVHDLGGGRFDATVLRREAGGFTTLGVPEAITDLGGLDLDELVWQHVRAALPDDVPPVARVRRACTRAKETLSSETEVVVRIRRGEFRGAVHLDRATFEGLIKPQVDRTVAALRRTIASAGPVPGQPALLLVGGSARIPLVARTVAEQFGRTPDVHADAGLVARGAVLALTTAGAAAAPGALVSTASGYLAVDPAVAGRGPAEDDAEAPTVVLAVPAPVDGPTTPFGTPAVVRPVDAEPEADPATAEPTAAVSAAVPAAVPAARPTDVSAAVAAAEPAAVPAVAPAAVPAVVPAVVPAAVPKDVPAAVATAVPAAIAPAARPQPVPAFRPPGRGRSGAVLDPVRRGRRRSLPRTLLGVGAVLVAVLVLVALLRPDGPLDPPLDPVAGDGASRVPVAVAPPSGAPVPAEAEITEVPDDRPSAVRPAALRPSVTTTPPPVPAASVPDPPAAPGTRAAASPTGLTPPTPAA